MLSEKEEGNWWRVKESEVEDLKIEPKKEFKRIEIEEDEEEVV